MGGDYLVWSHEHGAWWAPHRRGYTYEVEHAGRYSRHEAIDICREARLGRRPGEPLNEFPVSVEDLDAVIGPA